MSELTNDQRTNMVAACQKLIDAVAIGGSLEDLAARKAACEEYIAAYTANVKTE
jgi:hypothetical protein